MPVGRGDVNEEPIRGANTRSDQATLSVVRRLSSQVSATWPRSATTGQVGTSHGGRESASPDLLAGECRTQCINWLGIGRRLEN
jgi:hypothetical protein